MLHALTGYRRAVHAPVYQDLPSADKRALFDAARNAIKVLDLARSSRNVLERLIACFQGELVQGRILVWPANEWLEDETGLSERAVRYAVRDLIQQGVITSKDSANGKRFARRSRQGQIIDAFGLDLTPLYQRADEFKQRAQAIKDREKIQKYRFEEITIARRRANELLIAMPHPALQDEFETLAASSPRRAKSPSVDPALALWRDLLKRVEAHFNAASGGKDCRHKDTNNDSSDQSCNKGLGVVVPVSAAASQLHKDDLLLAFPQVFKMIGPVRSVYDLLEAASTYRGSIGISQDAWVEACGVIGKEPAVMLFLMTWQRKLAPTKGSAPLHSAGGYFRSMVRLVREGKVDLMAEIKRMRDR